MIQAIVFSTILGVFIIIAFTIGLIFGVGLRNNKEIRVPNPIKMIEEKKQEKKEQEIQNKQQTIMEMNLANIEAYDGTEFGQKDIPR